MWEQFFFCGVQIALRNANDNPLCQLLRQHTVDINCHSHQKTQLSFGGNILEKVVNWWLICCLGWLSFLIGEKHVPWSSSLLCVSKRGGFSGFIPLFFPLNNLELPWTKEGQNSCFFFCEGQLFHKESYFPRYFFWVPFQVTKISCKKPLGSGRSCFFPCHFSTRFRDTWGWDFTPKFLTFFQGSWNMTPGPPKNATVIHGRIPSKFTHTCCCLFDVPI